MKSKRKNRSARAKKRRGIWIAAAVAAGVALLFAGAVCYGVFHAGYGTVFSNSLYSADAFAGQRVLFIVPHEDDELNMSASTIRLYVDGGAEVWVLFATNGDDGSDAAMRFDESLSGLSLLGVPSERVLFLGYGDKWTYEPYLHIYHAPDDEVISSLAGRTETYGTAAHPDFRTMVSGHPSAYTRRNYLTDLKDAVAFVRADTIFCIDLDSHADHCVVSLLFEEAMGQLLPSDPSYRPAVYKGYAYNTAWHAPSDFYAPFLLSTKLPVTSLLNDSRFLLDTPNYSWTSRVRFPVPRETLGQTVRSSLVYKALQAHVSQDAASHAKNIINGDTLYWRRRTDSLLQQAGVTLKSTSGDPTDLNDFKLVDTDNVYDWPLLFNKGLWQPDGKDASRLVNVAFAEPVTLDTVVLYDYYDPACNITSGRLTFSDGSTVEVGALQPNGEPTAITFEAKSGITNFSFAVQSAEGEGAGLSEIEAFAPQPAAQPQWIKWKLTEEAGDDFLYRCPVAPGQSLALHIYTYPASDAELRISLTAGNGEAQWDGQTLTFSDRAAGTYVLRAELAGQPSVYDEVEFYVPTLWQKVSTWTLQTCEYWFDRVVAHFSK